MVKTGGGRLFGIAFGLTRLIAVFLVMLFAMTAANKAGHFATFVQEVAAQGLIPNQLVQVLAAALILFEFILSGWLLLALLQGATLWRPLSGFGIAFLFFIGYAFLMVITDEVTAAPSSCGCGFPLVGSESLTWQGVMIRNGVFRGMPMLALVLDSFVGYGKFAIKAGLRDQSAVRDSEGSILQ